MLNTSICSFIMREQPEAVLTRLEQAVLRNQRIVVSAITWTELSQLPAGPALLPNSWLTPSPPASMPSCPVFDFRFLVFFGSREKMRDTDAERTIIKDYCCI